MPEVVSTVLLPKWLLVFLGFLVAAVANAIQHVNNNGWKGMWMFIGNVVVAVSAGQIMYSFLDVFKPEYALSVGFAAAYIGPNSIKVLWEKLITTNTK